LAVTLKILGALRLEFSEVATPVKLYGADLESEKDLDQRQRRLWCRPHHLPAQSLKAFAELHGGIDAAHGEAPAPATLTAWRSRPSSSTSARRSSTRPGCGADGPTGWASRGSPSSPP